MYSVTSLLIIIFLCMHACIARQLPLFNKDFHQQIFPAKMAKVVNFNMNQEENTNANKSMVERSDHNPDEDSANILDAAKEKTEDHRGVISNKSLVSVSWHLQQKNQNKNPVFFSDYSRPTTRPPSHN